MESLISRQSHTKNYLAAVLFSSLVLACSNPAGDGGGQDGGDDGGTAVDAGGGDGGAPIPDGGRGYLTANVGYALQSVAPNEALKPNTTYDLTFALDIHSSLDEQFQLVPRIDAGWSAVVKDSDKIDAVDSGIKGLKVTKVITVTTGAAGAARLVLNLNGTSFVHFNNSSQPTPLTVGAAPMIPPSGVQFINVQTMGMQCMFRDNTLFVKRQRTSEKINDYLVSPYVVFWDTGTFQISAPTANPSPDWQPERVSSGSIAIGGAGAVSLLSIRLQPKITNGRVEAADGQFTFTITSVEGHYSVPFSAELRVVDALPGSP